MLNVFHFHFSKRARSFNFVIKLDCFKTKSFLTVSRLYRWIVIADETLSCFLERGTAVSKTIQTIEAASNSNGIFAMLA